ncbi:sensor histidine kinase [Nonomuraea roseoviolacea]|uniref:histidine kinase n=1 Tax=Nonomuraea roseoviolacea subsp. carminata TaxID=160689 RepID=A0ABT1KBE1_9ACTN|nr:histidine kinase [Nonomuraea roseoviolacea]MCP2350934.1 signal transduction histidine kinase [Nonomuraea roseoviolacea subsp. carminata]
MRVWGRPRRVLVRDALLAVLVAAVSLTLLTFWGPGARGVPVEGPRDADALGVVLVLLACVPVAVRRRWPLTGLCAALVPETALEGLGYGTGLTGTAGLVMLYSVAAYRGLAVALGGLALSLALYTASAAAGAGAPAAWSDHLVVVVALVAVWGVGRSLRLRRAYMEELRDRAARLERARAADRRAARAEERSRIARELHDVVAHHVSVMTVQASAARRVLASDPGLAGEALTAIEETGRMALTEMRNIVGVLRADARAELGPQPGTRDLPALVDQMREAGLATGLTVEGAPGPVPAGVDLAAYRLVQEGLTNALRHAGAGATARVTVRYEPHELDVRVEDDGRGPGGNGSRGSGDGGGHHTDLHEIGDGGLHDADAHEGGGARPGRGHGLVGIRERVALYGGILSIGPRPGGGFEVRARFPLKDGQ